MSLFLRVATKQLNLSRREEPLFLLRKRKTAILCLVAGSRRAQNHSESATEQIFCHLSAGPLRGWMAPPSKRRRWRFPLFCAADVKDMCVSWLVPITMQRGGRCRERFYSCRIHQSVNNLRKIVTHPSFMRCTGGVLVSAHDD